MGEFAEAAERIVMGADSSAADTSSVAETSDPSTTDVDTPDASAAPASEGTGSDQLPTERRANNGRFQRTVASTVPYTRFNEVTKQNQAYKADLDKLKSQFGWMDEQAAPRLQKFYQDYRNDPVGTMARELRGLGQSPAHRAQLAKDLQALMAEIAEEKEPDDPEPDPDFALDGTDAKFYSDKQLKARYEWERKQLLKEFQKELAPLKQMEQQMRHQQAYQVIQTRAVATAKAIAEPLLKNPAFQQHKAEIGERWKALRAESAQRGQSFNGETALYRVYAEVLAEKGHAPAAGQAQHFVSSLAHRASASALNPKRPVAAGSARPPSSFREAAERRFGMR